MIKVQTFEDGFGWTHQTRAGELPAAWRMLFSYRRDYPSRQHRLVSVSDIGAVSIITDDVEALAQAKRDWEIDREVDGLRV